jgi:hypothetical protein
LYLAQTHIFDRLARGSWSTGKMLISDNENTFVGGMSVGFNQRDSNVVACYTMGYNNNFEDYVGRLSIFAYIDNQWKIEAAPVGTLSLGQYFIPYSSVAFVDSGSDGYDEFAIGAATSFSNNGAVVFYAQH